MKKLIITIFLTALFLNIYAKAKPLVQRLEPASWWTEMKNQELQLMIYGTGISTADFSINYPGVSIVNKKLTDNPDFVFLYLNIAKETKSGKFNILIKKGK